MRTAKRALSSSTLREKVTPGFLHAMGKGRHGQLGLGPNTVKSLSPKLINLGEKVVDFDCHMKHSLAVTVSGRVFAWGNGDYGKLGFDASSTVPEPVHLPTLDAARIRRVVCGAYHSLALSEDGKVFSWGFGGSWFSGSGGLGHGNTLTVAEPKQIQSLAGVKIVGIGAGMYHSAAVDEDGVIYTWGKGELGRLGHGSNKDVLEPRKIESMIGRTVRSVACGSHYTAAILSSGTLCMWGKNRYGELGQEGISMFSQVDEPAPVEALKQFRTHAVACGNQHTAGLMEGGDFYVWGSAGFNWFTPNRLSTLSPPALAHPVIQVSCGFGTTGVVTSDGQVYTWGKGRKGQLGHGVRSREREPRRLELDGRQGGKALKICCSQSHSLLLTEKPLQDVVEK